MGAPEKTESAEAETKRGLSPRVLGLFVVVPLGILVLGGIAAFLLAKSSPAAHVDSSSDAQATPAGRSIDGTSGSARLPPAEPPGHWCKREGDRCLFAPGKFGTCVGKMDCDPDQGSCFTCQSQH